MDVWIKSHVDTLITDEVSHWGFEIVSFDGNGIMPLCLGGIFKKYFTTAILCCCSQFLVYVKNEHFFCMNSCLSASQLYDKGCIFCMSMPNKIFVSSSLSHMMKVRENVNLAIQRFKVALPSGDIADPSTVFKCTAAGSLFCLILVFNHVVYTSMD